MLRKKKNKQTNREGRAVKRERNKKGKEIKKK
jgi:hypothetical protein